jgi:hypothetical protein
MDAIKRWAIPMALILSWLVTAGYTLAALSRASAAWQMRPGAVHVEVVAKDTFNPG